MSLPLQVDRQVFAVPHTDLRLRDGRRLRRWAVDDPRRRVFAGNPYMPDHDGWDGPQRMTVIATLDDSQHGLLLHVSVSYQTRDPLWADLMLIKYCFFGSDGDAMLPMPREADFTHGVAPVKGIIHGAPGGANSHVFQIVQMPARWQQ